MELSSLEMKFLLRLLEHEPNYRIGISQIKPNSKTSANERDKACKKLCSEGLVEYVEEVVRYETKPAGKTLLKSDTSTIPVSLDELELLKVANTKVATPGQAKRVPASDRQRLLSQLKDRGLISVTKSQIKDVWLTSQGFQYLLDDCTPSSTSSRLTFAMLGHYLTFLRQSLRADADRGNGLQEQTSSQALDTSDDYPDAYDDTTNLQSLALEDVLNTIRQLDQQLNTDNFLPIFHLRKKLQPLLSREDLDQLLYDLQSRDLIELSTLQDVSNYSEAEISAGIPQNIGGDLFYISVSE